MTPYEKIRGQKHRKEMMPLGEQVLARRLGARSISLFSHGSLVIGWDVTHSMMSITYRSWSRGKSGFPPSPKTSKMGASSVERNALHTVVATSDSSGPPSFAETSI